ncbi:MAG: hypothetical protein KGI25_05300, partial [Thaumarchaeota archaeon]|nr:hypothetical protein [Nitrososphaerota archaeon]
SNTGYAYLKDPSTGVSVTISNSDSNVSFGIITEKLEGPSDGEKDGILANSQYFGVALLGISGGNAKICVPDNCLYPSMVMLYSTGYGWSNLSGISFIKNGVCGNVSAAAFMDSYFVDSFTDVVIGEPTER